MKDDICFRDLSLKLLSTSCILRHRMDVDHSTGRCTMIVPHCRPEDVGEYTCSAVNIVGETSTSAALFPVESK